MKYLVYDLRKVTLQRLCRGDCSKADDEDDEDDAFRTECA
jgi:hypothetical protein